MKQRIIDMIDLLKRDRYDPEDAHLEYDGILREYILADRQEQDECRELMIQLLDTDKHFWYA